MLARNLLPAIIAVSVAAAAVASDSPPTTKPIHIVLVGDSTVASYAKPPADKPDLTGWGQVFGDFFNDRVTVLNHAKSGRSTRSFIKEGLWKKALADKGDYIFIQFGHNDSHLKDGRPAVDAATDFQSYLRQYIDEARAAGAKPILVMPVARRTFKDGKIATGLQPYADAMFKVGKEKGVPVIDLHAAAMRLFDRLGDAGSADMTASASDRTHFSRKGAEAMARLVAEALPAAVPELRPYLKPAASVSPAATTGSTILTDAESVRLRELGSGVQADLRGQDFPLVAKALASNNMEDRQWACLAIEKICVTPGVPDFVHANRVAQDSLNLAYVDQCFPRLLDALEAKDSDLREFACRAIGSLADRTALLTPKQVAQSCEKAVVGLRSDDFEDRRRCAILLGRLTRRMDFTNEKEKQAVDHLLDIAEDWQRSNHFKWDEWQRKLAARGTAKQRFQDQAIHAVLRNCEFMSDKAQAGRAYQFLANGLQNQTLDLQAVVSIAALASRLPTAQRNHAVQLAMDGISEERFWYDVGSGRRIPRNYAADALCCLAPSLDKRETERALTTITSQRWDQEQAKVFAPAMKALRDRLAQLK